MKNRFYSILSAVIKYGLPLILSVGLCYYLYTKIDVAVLGDELKRCNYGYIALTLFVALFSHVFRAMRWRIQLDALGIKAPLLPLVWSIFGTYAVNLILPRLGELWRTGYIAQREKAPFTTVFGSMVADRLADTVTVLALTLFTFVIARSAFIDFAQQYPQVYDGIEATVSSPWLWLAAVAGIALVVWLFMSKTHNRLVLKIRDWVKGLWSGFAVVATMPGKGRWLIYTVALWTCYFMQLYLATFAFDFTEHIGVVATLVAFVLSSVSMGIPSNGGLGPWHMAVIFALGLYGVGMNQAAAFAMIVWGSQNAFIVLLGIYSFISIAIDRRRQSV